MSLPREREEFAVIGSFNHHLNHVSFRANVISKVYPLRTVS